MSNANSFSNSKFAGIKNLTDKKMQKIETLLHSVNLNIGDYKWSARTNDFEGWLKCDGRSVLKTDFVDLYNIIGNSFGSVDSLHFNLPNMNGRVLGQIGQTSNVNDTNHILGHSVGNENVTLSTTQIPSHSHTGTTNTSVTGITSSGTTATSTTGVSLNANGSHTHHYQDAFFSEYSGTNNETMGSHDTDYDNQMIWRDPSGGYSTTPQNLNTSTDGSHSHTINDSGHTHTFTANISDPSHSHTFTTNNTGGGLPFSVIQPTLFGGNLFIFATYEHQI